MSFKFLKRARRHTHEYAALKFLIKFNLFAIPLYLIILFDIQWAALQKITAQLAYALLAATNIPATINDFFITTPIQGGSWAAVISWDCVGWKSMLLFVALVFATDQSLRSKAKALALLPAIYAINIARIWFMFYYVHVFGLTNFALIHAVVWSWGLMAVVVILWLAWVFRFSLYSFIGGFLYRPKQ